MIDLRVTGCEQPEQSREEIARLMKVGAVCLLRDGSIYIVFEEPDCANWNLGDNFECYHKYDGTYPPIGGHENDIIRVFPPGSRLRVTVEVVE